MIGTRCLSKYRHRKLITSGVKIGIRGTYLVGVYFTFANDHNAVLILLMVFEEYPEIDIDAVDKDYQTPLHI